VSLAKLKLSRWAVILAVLVLGCFLFAGVTMAAPVDYAAIVIPDGNPATGDPTNVVKASHTYDYWVCSGLFGGIDVGVFADQPIVVDFPEIADPTADQFDLSPAAGKTVPVRLWVYGNEIIAQAIPQIDNVNHTATLVIQKQNLPQMGTVNCFQIEGLRVKNTCLPGSYCVTLRHPCFTGGVSACMALKVVPTVGKITLNLPDPPYVKGATVTVTGEVWNACGKPWPFDTWPVIIDIVDKKGLRAQDPYYNSPGGCPVENGETVIENCCATIDPCSDEPICPVIAHTKQLGNKTIFTAEIMLPACETYGLDYTIRARTIETQDCNADSTIDYVQAFIVDPQLVPAESLEDQQGVTGPGGTHIFWSTFFGKGCADTLEHAWLEALPQTVTLAPGVPACIGPSCLPTIPFDKPYNFCINVYDKFGNPTTVRDANGIKVDLAAYTGDPGYPGKVAGIFRDAIRPAGNEITHIYIPQGETGICVWFYPKELGSIVIEGRSIINGNKAIARCWTTVVEPTGAILEVTPKVTNDNGDPVAGWPLASAIWLKDEQGNDINATQDYDVYISLRSANDGDDGNWAEDSVSEFCSSSCAMWDTALDVTFGKAGANKGDGDIYVDGNLVCEKCYPWAKYTHPYCTVKSHFYIYPSQSCACNVLYAQAKLVGKTNNKVILTNTVEIGPFADPVELKRVLEAEKWQILSTPQELVGSGGMDSILPASSFTDILTYKDYQWNSLAPSDKLNPLYAYYVKTKQRATQGDPNCYVAKYIFKRVTQPGQDVPPTRTLVQGWNLVGVAMPSEMTLPPAIEIDLTGNCRVPNCDTPNCEGYPCAKLYQPEFLGKMLGTTCEACKKTYNPGGPGLDIVVDLNPNTGIKGVSIDGDPNKMANLAGFTAADVSQGTLEAWALDPLYLVFNGDGYWIYMTKTQTLAAEIGQELIDP
jgi:hypothetical protein